MSNFVKIACPSCGGLIVHSNNEEYRCENCDSRYFISQDGNKISIIPIIENLDNLIIGNEKVFINLNQGSKETESNKHQNESGECPICGRSVGKQNSFRCKRCDRNFICLTHQNPNNFLCADCMIELSKIKTEERNDVLAQKKVLKKEKLSAALFIFTLLFGVISFVLICLDIVQSLQYLAFRSSSPGFSFAFYYFKGAALITLFLCLIFSIFLTKFEKKGKGIIGFILIGITMIAMIISILIYPHF